MKQYLGLSLNLRQELKLQPRQILCNELLTLPMLDLQAALRSELDENIFLEADEKTESLLSPEVPAAPEPQMTPPGGDGDSAQLDEGPQDAGQLGQLLDYLQNSRTTVAPSGGDVRDAYDVEARAAPAEDWRHQLYEALRLERAPKQILVAAEYITGCLDDRGMLAEPLEETLAEMDVTEDEALEALTLIQNVAPPGVGARTHRERLLLRCRALPDPAPVLERILEFGYDDLLNGRYDALRRKLGTSEEDLRDAIEILKELYKDPVGFEVGEPASGVTPDASVVWDEETQQWTVILHDEAVPRLRLSSYASSLAKRSDSLSEEAKEYLMRSMNRAKWMMDALEQRRSTLRRIVEAVVRAQVGFFEQGFEALVPLRQEDVSEELSLHASTVSRAVQEKYVKTSHGVFPLKAFFPRGVDTGHGQMARNSVQGRLAELVSGERHDKPLSDDQLVRMLKDEGIKLSRRTVCKYRDELGIAPASRRKGRYRLMKGAS